MIRISSKSTMMRTAIPNIMRLMDSMKAADTTTQIKISTTTTGITDTFEESAFGVI
jgi:hypothetical protein